MSFLNSMEINLVDVNNGKYNVSVIADDEYIGPLIARGYEWDGWMRSDISKHYKVGTDILDNSRLSDYEKSTKLASKILSITELNIYQELTKSQAVKYLAKQFTCKEAISKVIAGGSGGNKRALATASSCHNMKPNELLDIVKESEIKA